MGRIQRYIDAGQRYCVTICAIFVAHILCVVTKLDRIVNPDKYRIELPTDQETVSNSFVHGIV